MLRACERMIQGLGFGVRVLAWGGSEFRLRASSVESWHLAAAGRVSGQGLGFGV